MDKILVTANSHFALWNFRKKLIESLLLKNHVHVAVPDTLNKYMYDINSDITVCNIALNPRSKSVIGNIHTLLSCLYQLIRIRPKLVLSFTIKNNIYFGILCRFLNVSFIPNITGIGSYQKDCNKFQLLIINFLYRFSLKRAKHIFFQNYHDLNTLTKAKIVDSKRCSVLPGSGVDLSDFKFSQKKYSEKKSFSFVFASRLLIEKGIIEYLSAAKQICSDKNYAEVKFIVCGNHDENDERYITKKLLDSYLDNKNIFFMGNVKDIKKIISDSSCIVLPTYYNEGVPRILIESLAIGRPIITTNSPGCRETMTEGKTGYFVESQNSDDLKNKMESIMSLDKEEFDKMSYYCREKAVNNFSDEIIKKNYHKAIYNKYND